MQTPNHFNLAFVDTEIVVYVCILLGISVAACLIARRLLGNRNMRLIVYGIALMFAASFLYPIFLPLWTTARIDNSHLRIEGIAFSSEVALEIIDPNSAMILEKLPDSLSSKGRTGGVRFSKLSIGWFLLKNNTRSLQYITSSSDFVVLTTSEGYSVILTLDEPARFLEAIKTSVNAVSGTSQ